jgi:Tfp pilus assembly protein PilX
MRWPTPPEPGTIVGTGWTREQLVALDTDADGYTTLGYAQPAELEASLGREPRSAIEARTQRMKGRVEGLDLGIFRRGAVRRSRRSA